ncbi:MAG: hypothetical protein KJ831_02570, partial [Candidatus Eisenbacteria bacterium]|nr:hypothetical protein [Candidatus Eisenbacteria bacterium]
LHNRAIYRVPRTTGLCHVVLTRPGDVGLLWRSCSSARSFAAGFLRTIPRGLALALSWPLASSLMTVVLLQGTFTP